MQGAEPSLRARVSSGILWSGSARVIQQAIQFGLSVVLARLLSPRDYGLMAMVMVFTGLAGAIADVGFASALVQKREHTDAHANSVFWVSLAIGLLLTIITFVAAPYLAHFFRSPALTDIFQVVSVNFVLASAGSVPSALLQKGMQFKALGAIGTAALICSGTVGVVMALLGAGVWSLVAQTLSASIIGTAFRWWVCRWWPNGSCSLQALKDMWGFTGSFYGYNFMNYWARNADNLLIGKLFGAVPLGIYNRAYSLMLLPISQVMAVVGDVLFPALSSIQTDRQRVKEAYLRVLGVVALFVFPAMTGMSLLARPLILTIYGAKWGEAAVLLQILAPVSLLQIMMNSTGWIIFTSQGRTDSMLKWGACLSAATVASFVIGALWNSVMALALCYAAANLLAFYPATRYPGRLIDMKVSELIGAVSGPALASLVMAGSVWGAGLALPETLRPWQILAILTALGAASYTILALGTRLKACLEVLALVRAKTGMALLFLPAAAQPR